MSASDLGINPAMTLFEVTERYPATIAALVANGFEHVGDATKRITHGKMVTLDQAARMKGKDTAALISLLQGAVAQAATAPDLTLEMADQEGIFPTGGDVRVAGLLPCPVRIPLLEACDAVCRKVTAETGRTVAVNLAAASVGADVLDRALQSIHGVGDLPDIFLSAGFEAFFDRRNMARFRDKGVFSDRSWTGRNPLFADYDLEDPHGHYTMLAVVPAVFLVDRTRLGEGEEAPRSWAELLDERFTDRLALPVGDFDLFNGILLTIWKLFGDEGVAALSRNLQQGMHPSQVAGRFAPRTGDGPTVSVIPYFFSRMAGFNPDAEIVWPAEGAIVSPIFMLTKTEAEPAARKVAEFFASRAAGEILAHRGLFPSCHPGVENRVPDPAPFLWLGWDFILEHDLGELIPRVNSVFEKAGE